MTWTRLERAGLDMLISELALYHAEANICIPLPPGVYESIRGTQLGDHPRRMAARLALYLRLLRRVDAWERGEEWAFPAWPRRGRSGRVPAMKSWHDWHPLWLDAPPYDPAVTPRMRREANPGLPRPQAAGYRDRVRPA